MASSSTKNAVERALKYVSSTSRIKLQDLRDNPGARVSGRQLKKAHNQHGHTIGELQHAAKPPLGWVWGDFFRPWHRMFPGEKHFNGDINLRREYPPISLIELQRLIDLNWIDTNKLIDITTLCNTRRIVIDPSQRQFGVQLNDEGGEVFVAKVNLEVQWASEYTIAMIEKNGGTIRTAYYDLNSLECAVDPKKWFLSGKPIPPRKAPPQSLMLYYTNPRNRGYLADPKEVEKDRIELAKKYGYELPDSTGKANEIKKPTEVFMGIESGSIVSLTDKKVFIPKDPILKKYYTDEYLADWQY
ncbi:39S ribosomal protein L15, mitochondrial [Strongyloides ratti]|uniref:Large ribosomal subunit protein uL15m n=1 Tax=Strongyloides ratti TaxID=34506 RepID=A0A090L6V1_STRRB|nr:39S ribosomal protein L15, mitochondrial [Strongyloides ratti]CEF65526.1 39S ribosomal protein L15, mitochondrial [Strongyloides ratti]